MARFLCWSIRGIAQLLDGGIDDVLLAHAFVGFPVRIQSANGALIILDDWHHERDPTHQRATAACRDALLGKTSARDAYEAFIAFAQSTDILANAGHVRAAAKPSRYASI